MEKLNIKEMKAQDLRIGNLIYSNLTKENFNVRPEDIVNITIDNSTTEPIPLSEEYFLKFGFNNNTIGFWILDDVWFEMDDGKFFLTDGFSKLSSPFNFVHELQNLYYAITGGEELTL